MSDESQLSELFDKAFNIHNDLTNTSLLTNSTKYQRDVEEGIQLLEKATTEINGLEVFSLNESVDDVSSKNLKYLLIPALLGSFTLKLTSQKRLDLLEVAKAYFRDFLSRLKSYGLTKVELESDSQDSVEQKTRDLSLEDMAAQRNAKIQKYRQEKELNEKIEHLNKQMESDKITVDDEMIREYYLTLLSRWVYSAVDELKSIGTEMQILSHMKDLPVKRSESSESKKATFKPIILTKSDLQKKVFGLGYPGVPTMTIDEFVNKKFEEGSLSITKPEMENSLQQWAADPERKVLEDETEAAKQEALAEQEDESAIQRARGWDDWKDDHKRGWGNRQNMG